MAIKFTQYLLPDGRIREVWAHASHEIEIIAERLIRQGCRFEIEVLRNGMVSLTCELGEQTLAHEICSNGPEVKEAVSALVRSAKEKSDEIDNSVANDATESDVSSNN